MSVVGGGGVGYVLEPIITYAILHAIWTPFPPFLHVIRNGNV